MTEKKLLIALLGVSAVATIQAESAHQHGVANLNIAISKQNLVIELHTPADNILGFEFMPKTDRQKQKLSDSLSLLKQPDSLFEIPKQAQCNLKQTKIDNPFAPEKTHETEHKKHDSLDSSDEYKHDSHDNKEHETHTDFEIQYSYHCQQPERLTDLATNGLFKHFPNFVTLKVQWANDSQQSATTLTKQATTVSFNP
ncbi:MAG: hypothetical protein COA83_07575 [Methylophaga sp.]|nr:MAG: hypothetical protein COA83_07575 [Methylophaga sp.]